MKIQKGNQVFITGAGSGIGRATAMAMGQLGTRLFLTDINARGLDETVALVSKAGGEVGRAKALDVTKLEEVRAFSDELHKDFGPMDMVMNIAGIALFALIEDMTHAHWEKVIKVNLWGPIHVMECFVPQMIRVKKGYLVNVASVAGLVGAPWHAAYSASKSGLVGISETLHFDLRQHNIGVTVVCPGAVATPLTDSVEILGINLEGEDVKEIKKEFMKHAIPPESAARQIIRAIERNQFLLITSWDVKFVYFCKRCFPPLFQYILTRISRLMNSGRYPQGTLPPGR